MYIVGQQIRLRTSDDWNDLGGTVESIVNDTIVVFCVTMPLYRYYVGLCDADRVLEIIR